MPKPRRKIIIDPLHEYEVFIANKHLRATRVGFRAKDINPALFPFQAQTVYYNLAVGKSAAFLDTGLGKTLVELEFASQCMAETGKPAIILAPLAIAHQIQREADKFGYQAAVIKSAKEMRTDCINVCNYDRLHLLDFSVFGCIVLDESSILKSFEGSVARMLVEVAASIPYRLCASATPAPNDYTELAMHAEFLGLLSRSEMLARWFTQDRGDTATWRLKKHGVKPFWAWVASWAVMAEKPSDLGFSDEGYELPPIDIRPHKIANGGKPVPGQYGFFTTISATNLHGVKRHTIDDRAKLVTDIVRAEPNEAWAIWCDTNYEADALIKLLPEAIEVRGSHSPEQKEAALIAFASGEKKWIITKPSIAGFGLNWQHCARTVFVGRSFSYETWYQSIRRFSRFGQTRIVVAHLIFTDGEDSINAIIGEKSTKHSEMKLEMRAASRDALTDAIAITLPIEYSPVGGLPTWL